MKRPQGFDRPPERARATHTRRSRDVEKDVVEKDVIERPSPKSTERRSDATTEPITLPQASATLIDEKPPSARSQLRAAKRERRRFERGEVRRFTKRTRKRRTIALVSAIAAIALLLFVVLGAFSPLMALHTIRVDGASKVDAAAVGKALSSQLGRPLALVDQGAIRRDLAGFPLIKSYSTVSKPPNTLVVRIVERQPIGVLKQNGRFDVVDSAGVVLSSSGTQPKGYPLIDASGADQPTADNGFSGAVAVLAVLPATLGPKVTAVTATTRDDVTLTLTGGITVVWGSAHDSALKARVLAKLVAATGSRSVLRYDVSSPKVAVVH